MIGIGHELLVAGTAFGQAERRLWSGLWRFGEFRYGSIAVSGQA
jgi:hypothetical protein